MKKLLCGILAGVTLTVAGLALTLVAVAPVSVKAAVTAVLRGPSTYADSQWKSVTIRNLDGAGNYTAVIDICPDDPAVEGIVVCIPYVWTNPTPGVMPAAAQTIVNFLITAWYTGTSSGLPNTRFNPP
jgi:hypothetical protein